MNESADHADFSRLAGFQKLHAGDIVRRNAPMQAHLDGAVGFTSGLDHRFALENRVADGLFDIDVSARVDGSDRYQRVPMVGRGDNGDLGPLALQELAEIFIASGLRATKLLDVRGGGVELVRVHIAHSDDLSSPRGHRRVQDVHAPPTRADERDPELLWLLAEDGRESIKGEPRARRGLDESSACAFHESPAFAKINSRFPLEFTPWIPIPFVGMTRGGDDRNVNLDPRAHPNGAPL